MDNNDRLRDITGALFCLLLAGMGIAAAIIILHVDKRIKLLDKRLDNIELSGSRQVMDAAQGCNINWRDITLSLYFDSDIGKLKVICPPGQYATDPK